MKLIFSFDDGRVDAYEASQILYSHGLCGSFHVTTGFIDGSFETNSFGVGRLPLTTEMIKEMVAWGMEISSHGDKHIMDQDDFLQSFQKISDMSGCKRDEIGFSVPNSDYSPSQLKTFVSGLDGRILYVRVGRSKACYTFTNKVNYVLYHTFHLYSFFKRFNMCNLLSNVPIFEINSLVVKSDTKIDHLIRFIDENKNADSTLVLMFHSITGQARNEWEYSRPDFTKLCAYISAQKAIRVITMERLAYEK